MNTRLEKHSDLILRDARPDDGEVIGRYGANLMSLHHRWNPERFIAPGPSTPDKYAQYLRSQIGRKDVVLVVAEAGGQIVGYAFGANESYDYMALRGPAGIVHDIFVEENSRGCGVGRKLLDAIIAKLKRLGAPQIVLSTAYINEAGQGLFRSAGFQPTMVEMTLQVGEDCIRPSADRGPKTS